MVGKWCGRLAGLFQEAEHAGLCAASGQSSCSHWKHAGGDESGNNVTIDRMAEMILAEFAIWHTICLK